jgi:hypothetical protein
MIRAQHEHAPIHLKLEPDRFPDLNLRIGGGVVPFEVVDADRAKRRRGDEYRNDAEREGKGLPPRVKQFDPLREENKAGPAIRAALEVKARKHYRPAPALLIYVNLFLFRRIEAATLNRLAELAAPHRDRFSEVWLLWGSNAIRCSPDPIHLAAQRLPPELTD